MAITRGLKILLLPLGHCLKPFRIDIHRKQQWKACSDAVQSRLGGSFE